MDSINSLLPFIVKGALNLTNEGIYSSIVNYGLGHDFLQQFAFRENGSFLTPDDLQLFLRSYSYNGSFHSQSVPRDRDQYCHPFGDMFEMIHSYYLPSMIFIGLVGNLLSCIVFLNSHLKMRSSSYYLAALACADFGFLASLLLVWLNSTLEVPLFNKEGYCQCIVYVSSVCGFLSVWLIVAFTVERFIAVQYPLHRPQMCTVARAKAIVLYLLCIALASHTYVFLTSGVIKLEDGSQVCEMIEGHREAMRIINIIDSLLTLIAPLVLIVVMNTMITVNLFKFSKKFKRTDDQCDGTTRTRSDINLQILASNSKSSSNNNNNNQRNPSQQSFHSARSNNSFGHLQAVSKERSAAVTLRNSNEIGPSATKCLQMSPHKKLTSTRTQQSITKMLLLISTVFVFLNLPSYGIRLYVFIFFSIWSESPPVLLWCMQQMFMILYYTNFSINFLLYSMCGITFRRCLWQLIRKKLKKLSRVIRRLRKGCKSECRFRIHRSFRFLPRTRTQPENRKGKVGSIKV